MRVHARDVDPAAIRAQRPPIVVKADGLAAGKGVIVAASADEAIRAAERHVRGRVRRRGPRVVIEEFLEGEEASFIVMADGRHVLPLATSQDHKRSRDGDAGPNTGGMGAYSPAPVVTPAMHERIMREVIDPTLAGLAAEGMPLHRLPVRRADDRAGRHAERARVQLPLRRPGNAADARCGSRAIS